MQKRKNKRAIPVDAAGPPGASTAPPRFAQHDISRGEQVLVCTILVAGIVVRLIALSQAAVEHFDEGVYASNIYFGAPAYAYPQQRYYAPPLLPALIEFGMIVGLPPNLAALLPSFLAGCGTIVAVWWLARSWFGPAAGLSAATLVALSDFHVLLSTAALTDALLGLWLVLAIDAIARSLVGADYRWAVAGGLLTGLAWWTKYNGWLPLAIEGAALAVLWLVFNPPLERVTQWATCFFITALTAALVWSPYYFSLQAAGGYAPIAENHAKYVVGMAGWIASAARQTSNHCVIERLLSPVSLGLAVLIPSLLQPDGMGNRLRRGGVGIVVILVAFALTGFVTLLVTGVIGVVRVGLSWRTNAAGGPSRPEPIPVALVAVWFISLFLVTPFYTPYARLTLPLFIAAAITASLNMAEPVADWQLSRIGGMSGKRQLAIRTCILGGLCLATWLALSKGFELGRSVDRREVKRIAGKIQTALSEPQRVFYVFGEPAMFFQLRASGEGLVVPVESVPKAPAQIEGRPVATFLIAGPHAARDPKFADEMENARNWQLIETWNYHPSPLVSLDLHDPRESPARAESVRLFRYQQ